MTARKGGRVERRSRGMRGMSYSPWLIVLAALSWLAVGFMATDLPPGWNVAVVIGWLWVLFGIGEYRARRRRP